MIAPGATAMKIAIVSDTHNQYDRVERVVKKIDELRVALTIHCGDIEDAEAMSSSSSGEVVVFHAGTARDNKGNIVTAGGRVLGVTALADDLQAARDLANAASEKIHFEGAFWRHDIGDRVLAAVK